MANNPRLERWQGGLKASSRTCADPVGQAQAGPKIGRAAGPIAKDLVRCAIMARSVSDCRSRRKDPASASRTLGEHLAGLALAINDPQRLDPGTPPADGALTREVLPFRAR